jgi:hypothetical protein
LTTLMGGVVGAAAATTQVFIPADYQHAMAMAAATSNGKHPRRATAPMCMSSILPACLGWSGAHTYVWVYKGWDGMEWKARREDPAKTQSQVNGCMQLACTFAVR